MSESDPTTVVERTLAVFELGSEAYAVDTHVVREIARMQAIAPVPNTPGYLDGVTNLRGRIIPVVDLRMRFSMPAATHTSKTRIVIVELADNLIGLVVDAVNEVRTIREDEIDDAVVTAEIDGDFISGMLKLPDRLIILLDLAKVFEDRLPAAA